MESKHTALICLGANVPDAAARISDATEMLSVLGRIARRTPPYRTAPEYAGETVPYLNCLLELSTVYAFDELSALTKRYQTAVRNAADAAQLIAVDIDIVVWDGEVIRPADYNSAYLRKGLPLMQAESKKP